MLLVEDYDNSHVYFIAFDVAAVAVQSYVDVLFILIDG